MQIKHLTIASLALLLAGCNLFKYHPYDGQTDLSDINQTNIDLITKATEGKEEFSFVWMGDTQRHYDETEELVEYVNENLDVDFVLHGGDITDFGITDEFEWIHDIMSKLEVPYVALIGNHDTLGSGVDLYGQIYGDDNYSFTVADVEFIALNTNVLEYNEGANVPNYTYIAEELVAASPTQRTIALMHASPDSSQFGWEEGTKVHNMLTQFPNLMICLNAHGHCTLISDWFEDGVIYYQCNSVDNRSFMLFTITKDGYEYQEIFF